MNGRILKENTKILNRTPEWHKELVLKRLEDYKQNPDSVMDFGSAMNDIEKEK